MTLNLEAKTKGERKVKAYLEANASEILAEKINNGVRIQKDGKTLLNKKSLDCLHEIYQSASRFPAHEVVRTKGNTT